MGVLMTHSWLPPERMIQLGPGFRSHSLSLLQCPMVHIGWLYSVYVDVNTSRLGFGGDVLRGAEPDHVVAVTRAPS